MMEMPPLPKSTHAIMKGGKWLDGYTPEETLAFAESCARMAREEAAKIAEETIVAEFEGVDYYGDKAAAAIRKG